MAPRRLGRVADALRAATGRIVVANSPSAASSAIAPTARLTPRQPMTLPAQAASGTPTSSDSDCPDITQPSARPRWRSTVRAEASVMITPVKPPAKAPASVTATATLT